MRQLLAYTFAPGSRFEGNLVGALERIESGGTMRILDALFVAIEPDSGELGAVSLSTDSSAGMLSKLLTFRLDPTTRQSATARVLEGPAGAVARSLASTLEPGGATAAILVEHKWALTLEEAIGRMGGEPMLSEFISDAEGAEVWSRLITARSS